MKGMCGTRKTNSVIDLFKFVFSALIVVCHSQEFYSSKLCFRGALGVEFFFMVSGYLMAVKAMRNSDEELSLGVDTIRFLRRKYNTFLPNFVVAILCSLIVSWVVNHWSAEKVLQKVLFVIPELLCLQMYGFNGLFYATGVAWYLSAMLIVMMVYYPLLRRYKDTITKIVAPLAVFIIYGYLWRTHENLSGPSIYMTFIHKGVLKGMAGISLGLMAYEISLWLQSQKLQSMQKWLLSFLSYSCMIAAVSAMWILKEANLYDFYIVGGIFVGVAIIFADIDPITEKINQYNLLAFRKASVCLFFNNYYFATKMNKLFADYGEEEQLIAYFLLVAIFSVFNYCGAQILMRSVNIRKRRVSRDNCQSA